MDEILKKFNEQLNFVGEMFELIDKSTDNYEKRKSEKLIELMKFSYVVSTMIVEIEKKIKNKEL